MTDNYTRYLEEKYPKLKLLGRKKTFKKEYKSQPTQVFYVALIDNVRCQVCEKIYDSYWRCQDCGLIECYACALERHNLRIGEIKLKCLCGSNRLFWKHNILTLPMPFRHSWMYENVIKNDD